jgi:DNA-binding transcriptional LysR family regulator
MTLLEIDAFLAVVKTGSITAASEQLFITQPSLSRRILALENELGYPLLERGKGIRMVRLTQKGKAFVTIANKWKMLWQETENIAKLDESLNLNVVGIGSLITYVFPEVFRKFLKENENVNLSIQSQHSLEAYSFIESGLADVAFTSAAMYSKNVKAVPAFREPMCLVAGKKVKLPSELHPSKLNVSNEIRVPWSPEFEIWHDYWFGASPKPRVRLDQMSVMEYFLEDNSTWAIAPVTVAEKITEMADIGIFRMKGAPPDRVIYYLSGNQPKEITGQLLLLLEQEMLKVEGVISYL